jgi:hypothetical protein
MLVNTWCEKLVNEVVLGCYTFGFFTKIIVEWDSSYSSLNDKLSYKRDVHSYSFPFASLVWKKSEDLFTTISADIFVLRAKYCYFSVVYFDFRNDTVSAFNIKWSHLNTFIMCDSTLYVNCTNEVFSDNEYRLSQLLVPFSRISCTLKEIIN